MAWQHCPHIQKRERLEDTIESIRERFGKNSILPATLCRNIKMPTDRDVNCKCRQEW